MRETSPPGSGGGCRDGQHVRRRSSLAQITDMIWGTKSADKAAAAAAAANNCQNASSSSSQGTKRHRFSIVNGWSHPPLNNRALGQKPFTAAAAQRRQRRRLLKFYFFIFLFTFFFCSFHVPPAGGGGRSRMSISGSGRRESLVDMAFGNLPWIRRQSSTTSGPTASSASASSAKRRDSAAAAFPKKSVIFCFLFFFFVFFFFFCFLFFPPTTPSHLFLSPLLFFFFFFFVFFFFFWFLFSILILWVRDLKIKKIRGDWIRAWVPVLAVQLVSTSPSSSCHVVNATALYRLLQASVVLTARR